VKAALIVQGPARRSHAVSKRQRHTGAGPLPGLQTVCHTAAIPSDRCEAASQGTRVLAGRKPTKLPRYVGTSLLR
jgi:hypothetical protein